MASSLSPENPTRYCFWQDRCFQLVQTKYIIILLLFLGCSNPKYKYCNDLLNVCSGNKNEQYCLFGFKFGETPQFQSSGFSAIGPQKSGGLITYSFHSNITLIDTHSANKIKTLDFDSIGKCAKVQIQKALEEWEQYGNFSFTKLSNNSSADIKFIVAEIEQGAIGWPNFQDELCDKVSGRIIFNNLVIENCDRLFILSLHEIGHALGLGHVSSRNIMNPAVNKFGYTKLQEGDIKGIQSIYGSKTENRNSE